MLLSLVLVAGLPLPVAAEGEFAMDRRVRLSGATKNNTRFSVTLPPDGEQIVPLTFRMEVPRKQIGHAAELELTPLETDGAPALHRLLRAHESRAGQQKGESVDRPERQSLEITFVAAGMLHADLVLNDLRPRTTYTGTLYLLHRGRKHEWDVTVRTTDRGTLTVDKLPPLQLVTLSPFAWWTGREFQISLRDAGRSGPFNRVRAHIVEPGQVKTTAIASNITLDAFSFWTHCWDPGGCVRVDLQTPRPADPVDVKLGGELKIWSRVEALSPGDYNPTLRFTADRASDRADDSKLALNLQVRHHWWVAVVVILLGSAAGLFGNKYVGGYWTARALRRDADDATQAAMALTQPDPRGSPWWCRSGSNSYGLARVRVILDQAARLSKSVFAVLAVEQEIRERVDDARRRLDALRALEGTRLRLLLAEVDRPAAQHRIKAAIRRALAILDGPSLGPSQKAALEALLGDIEAWLLPERQDTLYRDAVTERIRGLLFTVTQIDVPREKVRQRIGELVGELEAANLNTLAPAELLPYDHRAARLALLWRERLKAYAEELTRSEMSGEALSELHRIADRELWTRLRDAADNGRIQILVPAGSVKTYDLVEARLAMDVGVPEADIIDHPCLVRWRVSQPGGSAIEAMTYGHSHVQYFSTTGAAMFEAWLEWNNERIPITSSSTVQVMENEEYRPWASFQSVELAVTILAAVFAIVTGLAYGYNATFGSSSQYIGLFLWAAGASAGGNMFRQRGAGRTVGGSEMPFPGRAAA